MCGYIKCICLCCFIKPLRACLFDDYYAPAAAAVEDDDKDANVKTSTFVDVVIVAAVVNDEAWQQP